MTLLSCPGKGTDAVNCYNFLVIFVTYIPTIFWKLHCDHSTKAFSPWLHIKLCRKYSFSGYVFVSIYNHFAKWNCLLLYRIKLFNEIFRSVTSRKISRKRNWLRNWGSCLDIFFKNFRFAKIDDLITSRLALNIISKLTSNLIEFSLIKTPLKTPEKLRYLSIFRGRLKQIYSLKFSWNSSNFWGTFPTNLIT